MFGSIAKMDADDVDLLRAMSSLSVPVPGKLPLEDEVSADIDRIRNDAKDTGSDFGVAMKSTFQTTLDAEGASVAAGLEDASLVDRIGQARRAQAAAPAPAGIDAAKLHSENMRSASQFLVTLNRSAMALNHAAECVMTEGSNASKLAALFGGADEETDSANIPHGYPPAEDGAPASFKFLGDRIKNHGDALLKSHGELVALRGEIVMWRQNAERVAAVLMQKIKGLEDARGAADAKSGARGAADVKSAAAKTVAGAAPSAKKTPKAAASK